MLAGGWVAARARMQRSPNAAARLRPQVAFYFAFAEFYNTLLLPVGVIGLAMNIIATVAAEGTYMRLLPFWGFFVSSVWPFLVLKSWERHNAEIQFEWGDMLNAAEIEYANPEHRGEVVVSAAGELSDPSMKRWHWFAKSFVIFLFSLVQATIVLVLIASMITAYETQVRGRASTGGRGGARVHRSCHRGGAIVHACVRA